MSVLHCNRHSAFIPLADKLGNITSDQKTCAIPVVFVTSKNQKADQVWGELQGGKGMVSKPYTEAQIIDAIASV